MRFNRIMETMVKESVEQFVLSVNSPPNVCIGGRWVQLETVDLAADDLISFLQWATFDDQVIEQPLDLRSAFLFMEVRFTFSAQGSEIKVVRG